MDANTVSLPLTEPTIAKAKVGETLVLRVRITKAASDQVTGQIVGLVERFRGEKKVDPVAYLKEQNTKPITPLAKLRSV